MPEIYSLKRGKGTSTIVLLHGFCETHSVWDEFANKLAIEFTVITPDLPGFGKSKLPPVPFSLDLIGEILVRWLTEQHQQKPVVIGHSLGGYVALAMAAHDMELFGGLGLFHSTLFPDTEEKKANRNKAIDFVRRNGTIPFVESLVPGLFYQKDHPALPRVLEEARKTSPETIMAYSAAMRDRPDRTLLTGKLESPFMIIAGEQDSAVPVSDSRIQSKIPKNIVYQELTNCGHMGMFEQEEAALETVQKFIRRRKSTNP